MSELVLRLGILVLAGLVAWLVVYLGRTIVQRQRKQALTAVPPASLNLFERDGASSSSAQVRILAFSSEDCRPCHTLQAPALKKVLAERGADVQVIEIDAPGAPELVQTYRVLTVPTTVVLDGADRVHAINYGFANAARLLDQIDEVLSAVSIAERA